MTWEIAEEDGGIARLTVHARARGCAWHAAQVASVAPLAQGGGGWALILSDLKTLLETGTSFDG